MSVVCVCVIYVDGHDMLRDNNYDMQVKFHLHVWLVHAWLTWTVIGQVWYVIFLEK